MTKLQAVASRADFLDAIVDRWDSICGEGAYGYVDILLHGRHVGAVAVDRPSGERRWTTAYHDAIAVIDVDADSLSGISGSTIEIVARKILRALREGEATNS